MGDQEDAVQNRLNEIVVSYDKKIKAALTEACIPADIAGIVLFKAQEAVADVEGFLSGQQCCQVKFLKAIELVYQGLANQVKEQREFLDQHHDHTAHGEGGIF